MTDSNITLEDAKAAKRRAEGNQSQYVDAKHQQVTRSTTIQDQYLSIRDGVNLREEATTPDDKARTLSAVVDEFTDYVYRQYQAARTWNDEKGINPTSHRFTESSSKDRYGRTLGVDRAARQLWSEDLTTVHVVRRARPFGEHSRPQPAADFLDDLIDGNSNVYRAYRRHIDGNHGLTYARLTVVEPHNNGYAHLHDGLWIHDPRGVVDETDIYPAVDAHVRAVDQAQPRHHGPDAVNVRHDPDRQGFDNAPDGIPLTTALPRELTKHLAGLNSDDSDGTDDGKQMDIPNVLQSSTGALRLYATLWATGKRQWRPDRQEFKYLVGVSQEAFNQATAGDDNTVIEINPEDIDNDSDDPTEDIKGRSIPFEPFDGGEPAD
jgi:hypothetical protein